MPRITTTPKPPCVTKDGPVKNTPCKFPFIYEGREHTLCTKQEWHEFWCATDTDTEGNFVDREWGECGENCIGMHYMVEKTIVCYCCVFQMKGPFAAITSMLLLTLPRN